MMVPKTWVDVRAEHFAAEAGPDVQAQAATPAQPTEGGSMAPAATPPIQAPLEKVSSKNPDGFFSCSSSDEESHIEGKASAGGEGT